MTEHVGSELLNDYAERLLDGVAAASVEAHLATCARCAAEVEGVRALRAAMGSLPGSIDPGVDLRPAIRARRWHQRSGAGVAAPSSGRGRLVAAAALAAVALASLPAVVRVARGPAEPGGPAATLPPEAATVLVLDREYDRAADELRARLDGAAGLLPPETVRILGTTLASVNRALAESRAALVEDPASPILRELVLATHRQRLDVLRQAAELATEREEAT